MNVLFITRKYPPSVGGMETYSKQLFEFMSKKTNFTLYALKINKQSNNIFYLFNLLKFFITSSFKILFTKNQNVIHLGDMVLLPLCLPIILFKKKTKIVISAHGTDIAYNLRDGILPYIYKYYLRFGALLFKKKLNIIANSNATAKICYFHGFCNVSIIFLGVNYEKNKKLIQLKPSLKKYILFVGRLAKRKGLSWFVNNILPDISPNIELKVAGVIWDKSEYLNIKNNPRVHFLGPIQGKKLAKLRRESLFVIMPNIAENGKDFEGFGLVAIETIVDGGVLIASNIDGIKDAVINNKTGFLIAPEEITLWKKKIDEILKWNSLNRTNFINNGLEIIKDKFSWNEVINKTLKVYSN